MDEKQNPFSMSSKRITNRKRWVKEWIFKRKKHSHLNLLKEVQLSDPQDYQNYFRIGDKIAEYVLTPLKRTNFPNLFEPKVSMPKL